MQCVTLTAKNNTNIQGQQMMPLLRKALLTQMAMGGGTALSIISIILSLYQKKKKNLVIA